MSLYSFLVCKTLFLFILVVYLQPLPIHLSVCLFVCLVPPHVISPSGQPPLQTSLQAVPRCHPSIWLCGMSRPFSREGCPTTIRLHPSPMLCLLPSVLVSSFTNLHVCVIVTLGMNRFQCLIKWAFIPMGATVAATHNLTVKQVPG